MQTLATPTIIKRHGNLNIMGQLHMFISRVNADALDPEDPAYANVESVK